MPASRPEEIQMLIAAAFSGADREAFLALHEPDAVAVVPPDRRRVVGRDAILAATEPIFALAPRFDSETIDTLVADGLALTHYRWRLAATTGEQPVQLSGRGTVVSRRQPGGSWRIVLDDPLGPG
jgi:uncharacterized protein (TIGR02246 family)